MKKKGINNGNHSFKFIVPDKFLDGQYYALKLLDDNDNVVDSIDYHYKKVDFESEIRRYLAYSMTSPYLIFFFLDLVEK